MEKITTLIDTSQDRPPLNRRGSPWPTRMKEKDLEKIITTLPQKGERSEIAWWYGEHLRTLLGDRYAFRKFTQYTQALHTGHLTDQACDWLTMARLLPSAKERKGKLRPIISGMQLCKNTMATRSARTTRSAERPILGTHHTECVWPHRPSNTWPIARAHPEDYLIQLESVSAFNNWRRSRNKCPEEVSSMMKVTYHGCIAKTAPHVVWYTSFLVLVMPQVSTDTSSREIGTPVSGQEQCQTWKNMRCDRPHLACHVAVPSTCISPWAGSVVRRFLSFLEFDAQLTDVLLAIDSIELPW